MTTKSAKHYVLSALIPYSKANLRLTFKPSAFFAELDKINATNARAAKNAYYRALDKNLIEIDDQGIPRLTSQGKRQILPFTAGSLPESQLMVIFDIPECERWKRRHLRQLLKELSFKQIQKSAWITNYDHRELLEMEINQLKLGKAVRLLEVRIIK